MWWGLGKCNHCGCRVVLWQLRAKASYYVDFLSLYNMVSVAVNPYPDYCSITDQVTCILKVTCEIGIQVSQLSPRHSPNNGCRSMSYTLCDISIGGLTVKLLEKSMIT